MAYSYGKPIYITTNLRYIPIGMTTEWCVKMVQSGIIAGMRFGHWTALGLADVKKDRRTTWVCECDCGNKRDVTERTLLRGSSTGCGHRDPDMRSARFIDLTGRQFGSWTVVSFAGVNENGQSTFNCHCVCGTDRVVVAQPLREGKTVSCGCKKSELIAAARTQHGRAGSRAYQVWGDMIRRCTSPKAQRWDLYGGRGISVCEEWLIFENWNADMGDPPPGLSLDRIDNDGNYEKANCRWSTVAEQNKNRSVSEQDEETHEFLSSEWSHEYRAWRSMRRRCSPGNKNMKRMYFDRGIVVCPEWEVSFEQFLADMGPIPHPGWTLDREKNDLGYHPGNCRWADNRTQAINRRQNQWRSPNREQAA